MKRIAFILLVALVYSYTFAQQPAICGDWVGTFSGNGENGYYSGKRYVRVICDEGRYFVRMKMVYDGDSYVDHFDCKVYSADESTIKYTVDKGEGWYTDHTITIDGPTLRYTSSVCDPKHKRVTTDTSTLYREGNW